MSTPHHRHITHTEPLASTIRFRIIAMAIPHHRHGDSASPPCLQYASVNVHDVHDVHDVDGFCCFTFPSLSSPKTSILHKLAPTCGITNEGKERRRELKCASSEEVFDHRRPTMQKGLDGGSDIGGWRRISEKLK